jgi:hypothetical protein
MRFCSADCLSAYQRRLDDLTMIKIQSLQQRPHVQGDTANLLSANVRRPCRAVASWWTTILSHWPNVAYGRHKRSSRNRKGGSLGFALPELERPTQCKRCRPLSPICDCSRNIATPCYRLRGVGVRLRIVLLYRPLLKPMAELEQEELD